MKRNNKGFTLIELLAVLVITGIVLVIALQTYGHITKNSDSTKYNYQWNITKNAADIYSDGLQDNMVDGDCLLIDYSTLTFSQLIKENKEDISCNGHVLLIKDGRKKLYNDSLLECTVNDKKIKSKIDNISKDTIVTYDGDKKVELKQCISMNDASVTVKDTKTNKIKVKAQCTDFNYGIKEIQYKIYKDNETGTYITTNPKNSIEHTFENLKDETTYNIRVKCINLLNKETESSVIQETTKELKVPEIKPADDNEPKNGKYYENYSYIIKFKDSNVENPEHYFKSAIQKDGLITEVDTDKLYICDNNGENCNTKVSSINPKTWYKTTSSSVKITYKYTGTDSSEISGNIEAKISDGDNEKNKEQHVVFNDDIILDSKEPEIKTEFTLTANGTYKAKVTCTTGASGVKNVTIKCTSDICKDNVEHKSSTSPLSQVYEFREIEGGSEVKNSTYTHNVSCTNKLGKTITATPSFDTELGVNITAKTGNENWARSKTYNISYQGIINSDGNYVNKYFKSPYDGTVDKNVFSCGNGSMPSSNCETTTTTTISAGHWYLVDSSSVDITISQDIGENEFNSLKAMLGKGDKAFANYTMVVNKIDATPPTRPEITGGNTNWTKDNLQIKVTTESTSLSGIYSYKYCKSSNPTECVGGPVEWMTGKELTVTPNTDNGYESGYILVDAVNNVSNEGEWSIGQPYKIDQRKPNAFEISENEVTESSIFLNAITDDLGSGIQGYNYYINGNLYTGTDQPNATITGLNQGTTYSIYVIAIDNAGNPTQSTNTIEVTTLAAGCSEENPDVYPTRTGSWSDIDCNGTLTIGDLVTIGTKNFYVIENNGTNITIYSKQSVSGTKYASNSQHGTYYNSYSGSIVEQKVNNYVNSLNTEYGINSTGRLITVNDLNNLKRYYTGDPSAVIWDDPVGGSHDYDMSSWLPNRFWNNYDYEWVTGIIDETFTNSNLYAPQILNEKFYRYGLGSSSILSSYNSAYVRPVITMPISSM